MRCSRLCPSHHLSVWDSLKLIFVSLPLLQYSMKQIPAALGSFTPFSVSCPAEALVICTLLELPSAWLSSAAQLCPTLCDLMDCSIPGFPVHHQLLELAQTHVHGVSDAIQPSHPLSSPSPPAPNPSQHQDLFQCVSSLHQVAKVLELQLNHQSFQWIFRTDFL